MVSDVIASQPTQLQDTDMIEPLEESVEHQGWNWTLSVKSCSNTTPGQEVTYQIHASPRNNAGGGQGLPSAFGTTLPESLIRFIGDGDGREGSRRLIEYLKIRLPA
jgi:hypothetical protein